MAVSTIASKPPGSTPRESAPLRDPELRRLLGLSVPVAAALAERDMSIDEILAITVGAIVEFDVSVDRELILYVGNRPIGQGRAVKSGEHFGLRISQIDDVPHRIGALGG